VSVAICMALESVLRRPADQPPAAVVTATTAEMM